MHDAHTMTERLRERPLSPLGRAGGCGCRRFARGDFGVTSGCVGPRGACLPARRLPTSRHRLCGALATLEAPASARLRLPPRPGAGGTPPCTRTPHSKAQSSCGQHKGGQRRAGRGGAEPRPPPLLPPPPLPSPLKARGRATWGAVGREQAPHTCPSLSRAGVPESDPHPSAPESALNFPLPGRERESRPLLGTQPAARNAPRDLPGHRPMLNPRAPRAGPPTRAFEAAWEPGGWGAVSPPAARRPQRSPVPSIHRAVLAE